MSVPAAFGGGTFIADKSIWARSDRDPVRDQWEQALRNGQIATCSITTLELLYSARSPAEFDDLQGALSVLESIPVTEDTFRIAVGAMHDLANRSAGYHRIPIPDYIIAACAQEAGIGVLHYDRDFDRLQEVLDFESRWAADPGTLDHEGVPRT